jgi:alpha-amylase
MKRHAPPASLRAATLAAFGLTTVGLFAFAAPAEAGVLFSAHGGKWTDVTANVPAIKAAGYTAIQLSPHESSCSGGYGNGYDPYDFTSFESGFGTEAELKTLVDTVHAAGLQVYADMVFNHMGTRNYVYPRFSSGDFHHYGGIQNWQDQWQVENEDLLGLNDLSQESSYVRGELWNYMVKTNDMGFDGYRLDAAKHVPIWYWQQNITNQLASWGKYVFGEVYDSNLQYLQGYVNAGMAVTDYNLYFAMQNAFHFGGDLSTLDGAGYANVDGSAALTFVENQDVGAPANRMLAYAYIAAYPGYPYFFNVSATDAAMNNLVWIHNNKANGAYISRYHAHDFLIFERQGNLVAGINQSGSPITQWVPTSWKPGTRVHDFASRMADTYTNQDGWIPVTIPALSYVMLSPG